MPTEKTCQASIRSIMSDIYPVQTADRPLTPTLSPQAGRGGIAWFGSVVSALNNAVSVIPLLLSVSLELTQKAVTAFDGGVECGLGLVFAGERRFEILGNDVADLHQIAETQPP